MFSVNAKILKVLGDNPDLPPGVIAQRIERTPRATRDRLANLARLGLIVGVGSGPRDPRKVYRLAKQIVPI